MSFLSFAGYHIVITGASSGIGKSLACLFSSLGADVCAIGRDTSRLNETVLQMEKHKINPEQKCYSIALNVRDSSGVISTFQRELGDKPVDILVNNAGVSEAKMLLDTSFEEISKIVETNLLGSIYVTKSLLPNLLASKHKQICFVSSVLGYFGLSGYSAYSASKFGITGFCQSLTMELRKQKISCSIVYPADTATPQFERDKLNMPLETKILSFKPPLSTDQVAQSIAIGLVKKKQKIFPCRKSLILYYAYKIFPTLVLCLTKTKVMLVLYFYKFNRG